MQTGIFEAIPFKLYQSWDAMNNSRLGPIRISPAHFKAALESPSEDTDATILGRVVHTLVLQPEEFKNEFYVLLPHDGRTSQGKAYKKQAEFEAAGKTLIKQDCYEQAVAMSQKVLSHPKVGELISNATKEVSLLWENPEQKLLCKGRLDAWLRPIRTIFDIKTTEDASLREFMRTIFKRGYHRQAAWYIDGLFELGNLADHFVFIAVEKSPPYEVGVYRLKDEVIRLGRKECKEMLSLYKRCLETNNYPGYPTDIQDIGIPAWAQNEMEALYGN